MAWINRLQRSDQWLMGSRTYTGFSLLILVAYTCLLHRRVLLDQARFPYDFESYHYPLLYYAFRHIQAWSLPLWDSTVYSGMPFVANPQTGFFYPVHLLLSVVVALLGADLTLRAANLLNIVHYVLAGVGTFFLLTDLGFSRGYPLMAALIFVSAGYYLGQAQHLGIVEIVAWMPLALLLLRRVISFGRVRDAILFGLVLSFTFLVGFLPQQISFMTVLAFYALYLLGFNRAPTKLRNVALVLVSILIFAGVTAISWLSILEFHAFSLPLEIHGGAPLLSLVTAVIPNIFNHWRAGYWGPGDPTNTYFYAGMLVPVLLPVGLIHRDPRTTFFKILLLFTFLASFAPMADRIREPFQALPLIGSLFRPRDFLTYFSFSAIVLSVGALDGLERRWPVRATVLGWIMSALLLIPLSLRLSGQDVTRWALLTVEILTLMLATTLAPKWLWRRLLITVGLMEVFFLNNGRYFYSFPGSANLFGKDHVDTNNRAIIAFFKSDSGLFRISMDQERMGGGWNGGWRVWGLESVNGSEQQLNRHYFEYVLRSSTWSETRHFHITRLDSGIFKFLNVKYYLTTNPERIARSDLELVFDSFYKVYRYRYFVPRYVVLPPEAVDLDPGGVTRIIKDLSVSGEPAEVISYTTNERVIRARASGKGSFLFLSEVYYPAWRILLNGSEVPAFRVNGVLMGIPLPPGESLVRLSFQPRFLAGGAVVSLLSLCVAAILWNLGPHIARMRSLASSC